MSHRISDVHIPGRTVLMVVINCSQLIPGGDGNNRTAFQATLDLPPKITPSLSGNLLIFLPPFVCLQHTRKKNNQDLYLLQ